jgi:invasion protein IalB
MQRLKLYLLLAILIGSVANVSAAVPQALTFGNWLAECQAEAERQNCALKQKLVDDQGRKILAVTITKIGSGLAIEVDGPLGLSIPYGIQVRVDEAQLPLQLLSCSPTGCLASTRLDGPHLGRLVAAKSLAVVFKDFATEKVLSIAVSPKGLTQGVALIQAL